MLLGARFETIPMPSRFDGEIVPVYIMRFIARSTGATTAAATRSRNKATSTRCSRAPSKGSTHVTNNTQAPTLFSRVFMRIKMAMLRSIALLALARAASTLSSAPPCRLWLAATATTRSA